jgi:PAS domain S-box-containing protein
MRMRTVSPLLSSLADRLKLHMPVAMSTAFASGISAAYSRNHSLPMAAVAGTITGAALFIFLRKAKLNSPKINPDNMQRILDCAESLAGFGTFTLRLRKDSETFTAWSAQFRRLLGANTSTIPASHAEYIERYVHPEDRQRVRACLDGTLSERGSTTIEYRLQQEAGSFRHVLCHVEYNGSANRADFFHGQLHDITKHKQAEQERLDAAARFQSFVGQLGGMSYVASIDNEATNIYVSPKIVELLGFTSEQWCGEPGLKLRQIHEEDRKHFRQAVVATISSGMPLSIDYRLYRADGALRWFHDEARLATDDAGHPMFLHGVAFDITERKQAQEELIRSHAELKRLIGALDAVREDEQKRLAREMHDDLGQLLAAMKMDLSTLAQQLPPSEGGVLQRLDGINDLVNSMMISVRRIIADLPPKLLDDVGLIDALQLLVRNFETRYGVSCHLHLPVREPVFRGDAASMLYRLVQESLNNVAKHAQATSVDITLEMQRSLLALSIVDNGRGASEIDLGKHGSFGLICMRERVASLDGELRIETSPGAGMAVHVSLPVPEPAAAISTPGTHEAKTPAT